MEYLGGGSALDLVGMGCSSGKLVVGQVVQGPKPSGYILHIVE